MFTQPGIFIKHPHAVKTAKHVNDHHDRLSDNDFNLFMRPETGQHQSAATQYLSVSIYYSLSVYAVCRASLCGCFLNIKETLEHHEIIDRQINRNANA